MENDTTEEETGRPAALWRRVWCLVVFGWWFVLVSAFGARPRAAVGYVRAARRLYVAFGAEVRPHDEMAFAGLYEAAGLPYVRPTVDYMSDHPGPTLKAYAMNDRTAGGGDALEVPQGPEDFERDDTDPRRPSGTLHTDGTGRRSVEVTKQQPLTLAYGVVRFQRGAISDGSAWANSEQDAADMVAAYLECGIRPPTQVDPLTDVERRRQEFEEWKENRRGGAGGGQ